MILEISFQFKIQGSILDVNAFGTYSSLEARGVYLDISKSIDRVWHKGSLETWDYRHEIRDMGIDGNFLKLVD